MLSIFEGMIRTATRQDRWPGPNQENELQRGPRSRFSEAERRRAEQRKLHNRIWHW